MVLINEIALGALPIFKKRLDPAVRLKTSENANNFPAGSWYQNDIVSTSLRRYHVALTLMQHHFYVPGLAVIP